MAQFDLLSSPAGVLPVSSLSASMPDSTPEGMKSEGAYRTISEVADELGLPQHVLRFWETNFPQVKPKRMRGDRRYYHPEDINALKKIKALLYQQGYTIKGAKKLISTRGFSWDMADAASAAVQAKPALPPKRKPSKHDIDSIVSELRVLKTMLTTLL
jgi:DNA-binding transcriptional MerR regulator